MRLSVPLRDGHTRRVDWADVSVGGVPDIEREGRGDHVADPVDSHRREERLQCEVQVLQVGVGRPPDLRIGVNAARKNTGWRTHYWQPLKRDAETVTLGVTNDLAPVKPPSRTK
jgi:hypothetical protein